MDPNAHTIVSLYRLSNRILATAVQNLSEPAARVRLRDGEGPSIAWTLGHLIEHKQRALELLGRPRTSPYGSTFAAPATAGAEYPPVPELLATFTALNDDLCAALEASPARLNDPMPGAAPHGEKRILDTVQFLVWHEAYHIGVIGAMRREQGLEEIAALVRAGAASRASERDAVAR